MTVVQLDGDILLRITAEPTLYDDVSFLAPVKVPALKIATRLAAPGCKSCARNAIMKEAKLVFNAVLGLTVTESTKQPNQLPTFKTKIASIIRSQVDEVYLSYKDSQGKPKELRF